MHLEELWKATMVLKPNESERHQPAKLIRRDSERRLPKKRDRRLVVISAENALLKEKVGVIIVMSTFFVRIPGLDLYVNCVERANQDLDWGKIGETHLRVLVSKSDCEGFLLKFSVVFVCSSSSAYHHHHHLTIIIITFPLSLSCFSFLLYFSATQ